MASRRKNRNSRNEERRFTVCGIRHDPPDIQKLSEALIGLAMAEAERQAQSEQATRIAKSEVISEGQAQSGSERDE